MLQGRQRPLELVRIVNLEERGADSFTVSDPNDSENHSLTLDNVLYFDLIRKHITSALGVSRINFRGSELDEVENERLWTVTITSPEIDRRTFSEEMNEDDKVGSENFLGIPNIVSVASIQADNPLALKRCFKVTSPRSSMFNLDLCGAELRQLLIGLPKDRETGAKFWTNNSCKFDIIVHVAPSPQAFSLHQNLMAETPTSPICHIYSIWGRERFLGVITKAARSAYVENVYATTTFAELRQLIYSPSSQQVNRKVNMVPWDEATTKRNSRRTLTFAEQALDKDYRWEGYDFASITASIDLTIGTLHFAQQLTLEELGFKPME
ncbi:MAG: hypothetical protein M1812_005646 [Candelaria pacifica]|nr:MAG: hypothetical protein M1812_005646 [Candelaria pacifica]